MALVFPLNPLLVDWQVIGSAGVSSPAELAAALDVSHSILDVSPEKAFSDTPLPSEDSVEVLRLQTAALRVANASLRNNACPDPAAHHRPLLET